MHKYVDATCLRLTKHDAGNFKPRKSQASRKDTNERRRNIQLFRMEFVNAVPIRASLDGFPKWNAMATHVCWKKGRRFPRPPNCVEELCKEGEVGRLR